MAGGYPAPHLPAPPRVLLLSPERRRWTAVAGIVHDLIGAGPVRAGSTAEALALAEAAPLGAVVAAERLDGASTLPVLAGIRRRWPGCLLLVLADRYHTVTYLEASEVDPDGYLLWPELTAEGLRYALGAVLVGGGSVISRAARAAFARTAAAAPLNQLLADLAAITVTPVQGEILERLTRGLRQEAIAEQLGIGRRTVERQIAALRVQYDAPTTAVLVERAMHRGWTRNGTNADLAFDD